MNGLAPVAGSQVAGALARSGGHNPLLGFRAEVPGGTPGGQWCRPAPAADLAARLIDAVGVWLGTGERRVAASMVVLGYAARLVGPTAAVLVRERVLVDARPDRVWFGYAPDRGFQLALPDPAGWTGSPGALRDGWSEVVVDAHLRPVVDAVRSAVPVAAGLLWGNVASGLAGALAAVARDGAVPIAACHEAGLALLDRGPLRGTGTLSVHDGRLAFRRRSCCLYYRLDGGGMCADCALLPAD
jgi:ferric iron reductase protein FhuF